MDYTSNGDIVKQGTVMITVLVVAVIAIAAAFVLIGNGEDEKDDYVAPKDTRLWVFGNANMDDRLDEDDMRYLDKILSGVNSKLA